MCVLIVLFGRQVGRNEANNQHAITRWLTNIETIIDDIAWGFDRVLLRPRMTFLELIKMLLLGVIHWRLSSP